MCRRIDLGKTPRCPQEQYRSSAARPGAEAGSRHARCPPQRRAAEATRRLAVLRSSRVAGHARAPGGDALQEARPSPSALSRPPPAWPPASGCAGAAREALARPARPRRRPPIRGVRTRAGSSPSPDPRSAGPAGGVPQEAIPGPSRRLPRCVAPLAQFLVPSPSSASAARPMADSAAPGSAPSDPTRRAESPVLR